MTRDRVLLLVIAATRLISGFIEPFAPSYGQVHNEVTLPHAIVLAILLFAWCKSHAMANGVSPLPAGSPLLVAVLAPVGVPYYLFRAFPWRRALLGTGFALGFAAVCVLLAMGGQLVALRVAT